jgi:ubiquinone/menaquinone biosynthesis C-methylase UbiE
MTTTGPSESFQLPLEAAELYESAFVPGFFAQWAPLLCDAAGVGPGHEVLDVACGTGIVARTAAQRVGPGGRVVGVDLNEAMLTVARRVAPQLEWRQGDVARLPSPDGAFDRVLCQMALMFFPDRGAALSEMARVARPGATVGVLVPSRLELQPAFRPLLDMIVGHAGRDARSLLTTYFACGDQDELLATVHAAGLTAPDISTYEGVYGAPSVAAAVRTEIDSTPLGERISADVYRRILDDADAVLAPFTQTDGALRAPFSADVVVARRP